MLTTLANRFDFIEKVKEQFPEIKADLNVENSLWQCELIVIREFLIKQVKRNQFESVKRLYILLKDFDKKVIT